ncbi:hypothetical protein [Amycolatopsis sp. NPDC059657]|uniref:hypothetical protein n=1 Tax=Amycolatopsis sp. NPDC059657 TaxID=3346899 RepID=UPI00366D81F1
MTDLREVAREAPETGRDVANAAEVSPSAVSSVITGNDRFHGRGHTPANPANGRDGPGATTDRPPSWNR